MIHAAPPSATFRRQVFLTLAMLAIALKILIPPGFMAGTSTNDLPFKIYLCTAQGGVAVEAGKSLAADRGAPEPAPAGTSHDTPCAFAGHALSAPPPSIADAPEVAFLAYVPPAPSIAADLTPGRGLAGPPLPARGPPTLLT